MQKNNNSGNTYLISTGYRVGLFAFINSLFDNNVVSVGGKQQQLSLRELLDKLQNVKQSVSKTITKQGLSTYIKPSLRKLYMKKQSQKLYMLITGLESFHIGTAFVFVMFGLREPLQNSNIACSRPYVFNWVLVVVTTLYCIFRIVPLTLYVGRNYGRI